MPVIRDGGNYQVLLQVAQRLYGKQFQGQTAALATQRLKSADSGSIGGIVEHQRIGGLLIEPTTLGLIDNPSSQRMAKTVQMRVTSTTRQFITPQSNAASAAGRQPVQLEALAVEVSVVAEFGASQIEQ